MKNVLLGFMILEILVHLARLVPLFKSEARQSTVASGRDVVGLRDLMAAKKQRKMPTGRVQRQATP